MRRYCTAWVLGHITETTAVVKVVRKSSRNGERIIWAAASQEQPKHTGAAGTQLGAAGTAFRSVPAHF